ncbi:polyprenyl synthetase family protein [bacterium]|nr:polyprenyl synthetase family protein [bacterium]
MTVKDLLTDYAAAIDAHIDTILQTGAPFAADMNRYFFGWLDESLQPVSDTNRGKRLRPIMTLLTCEALTGSYQPALPLAAVVEIIHNYSLIHDDIADRDEERRGRPTVWKIWGDGLAINTGDALYTLAYHTILGMDLPPAKVVALQQVVVETALQLAKGQHYDITFERRVDVNEAMYLDMIGGKTAALLAAATRLGAMVGTDQPDVIDAYAEFGRNLGLAFQIQDDFLNIWVDAAITGKPQHSDLRNKKKSLPVTYAFGHADEADRQRMAAIYGDIDSDMTEDEIGFMLDVFQRIDARGYTEGLVRHHTDSALAALDRTGVNSPAQDHLRALAAMLIQRTS